MANLDGSRAKTRRAAQHLELLHGEVKTFSEAHPRPYRFVDGIDQDTSRYRVRVRLDREPPVEWSLIVGDVVHNLRCALDHLVWQLVYANGKRPSGTAFPIFDQRPTIAGKAPWNRMLRGVSEAGKEFIASCQPYQGTDGNTAHTLAGLRDLSNEDKHRVLLSRYVAIEANPDLMDINVVVSRDVAEITRGQVFAGRALEDGDPVVEAPITITVQTPISRRRPSFPWTWASGGRASCRSEG